MNRRPPWATARHPDVDAAAAQVRATGAVFTFGSMTAQERRVIHVTLAESEDLLTESVGEGPDRKLRVGLKKSNA